MKNDQIIERLVSPNKRMIKALLKAYACGAINSRLFEELVGKSPEYYQFKMYPKALRIELAEFVKEFILFEAEALTPIRSVYDAYFAYYFGDDGSIKRGEVLSRHKFTRWILVNHNDRIQEKVARIEGKPTRCFQGVKLLTLEEII